MRLPHRRQFLHLTAGAVALPAISRVANAQAYPTRPITMIVAFAAGGPTDVFGRVLAARMRDSLNSPSSSKTSAGPTEALVPAGLPARNPMAIRSTSGLRPHM
jgi:tripartite-type tricarboxylate transporter receptor subunit TctC